jgi:hypothetical protein
MKAILDTVLLLALPASGKSEVRKYLASVSPQSCVSDFHIGETVQLDDYPYVHFMRCIDDALLAGGHAGIFFHAPDRPFKDPRDWGTLIELLNEDYAALKGGVKTTVSDHFLWLFNRIDMAAMRAGGPARLGLLPAAVVAEIRPLLKAEAERIITDLEAAKPDTLDGKTIVIEFARGGAAGSTMPLFQPFGYISALKQLSPQILDNSSILYIWVTPEESRRKNDERTDPNDPGSILNHGVPIDVMLGDYGCDDMTWLLETSDVDGTVRVEQAGLVFHVPLARFDNRHDRTTFVRKPRNEWQKDDISRLHEGLAAAFNHLKSKQAIRPNQ